MSTTAQLEPRARSRRRARPFVVAAVVVIVLLVVFFIADAAAKAYARNQIRSQLVVALSLPPSTDVAVDVGTAPILPQVVGGSLGVVDVHVPRLAFGSLVGAADIRATGVPLDTAKPVGTLAVGYTVSEQGVAALAAQSTTTKLSGVKLTGAQIVATTTVTVLGASVPVTLGLTPSVSSGQLLLTPTTITAAGQSFTAEQLRTSPLFGALARELLVPQAVCVAQYLPKALVASSARVVGSTLVLGFTGDGAVLGGSDFRVKGSCS